MGRYEPKSLSCPSRQLIEREEVVWLSAPYGGGDWNFLAHTLVWRSHYYPWSQSRYRAYFLFSLVSIQHKRGSRQGQSVSRSVLCIILCKLSEKCIAIRRHWEETPNHNCMNYLWQSASSIAGCKNAKLVGIAESLHYQYLTNLSNCHCLLV